ncbi:MAG: hypothetical protein M1320_02650 [Patescibacteria group bacterium]|nr:hypothetical protein [Patescibacteria group bacterium]
MATKKYMLFMVSDNPIIPPVDTSGVEHLVYEELNIGYGGNDNWKITKSVSNHLPDINAHSVNSIVSGGGMSVSIAIIDWLKNLLSTFGYKSFRDKPKKQ